VWLDAADSSTITIATGVSEWRDKSGNGRHVSQSTAANQPAYQATGLNSMPTLRSAGSGRLLTATLSGFAGTNNLWAFAVGTMDSVTSSFGRLVSFSNGATQDFNNIASTSLLIRSAATNAMVSYRNGIALNSLAVSLSAPMIVGSQFNSSGNTFYVNGTGSALNTSGGAIGNFATAPRISLFYHGGSGDSPWTGNLSELVLGDTALSTANRQLIEGYLAWKWGLTANLPTAHPFKNRPPLVSDI
jgi:hypothetical protein